MLNSILVSRGHVDLMSDCYLVHETGEFRIVEWAMAGMRLRHFSKPSLSPVEEIVEPADTEIKFRAMRYGYPTRSRTTSI